MRVPSVLSLLVGAISIGGAVASPAATTVVERRVSTMGTTLGVSVEGPAPRGDLMAEAERLVAQVESTEDSLSTWRDDSQLASINRAPVGEWQRVAEPTWTELSVARDCAKATDGAFDPTVAPLVEAWGLRTGGRVPTDAELADARRRTGWSRIALDPGARRLRKLAPSAFEEGGFGKGAALDRALESSSSPSGRAALGVRLDLGGQWAWAGQPGSFEIELADPADRTRSVAAVSLLGVQGSAATSGNSERRLLVEGVAVGHLLDPRTGSPALDFGSVTVIVEDGRPAAAEWADCLSTALFVMGPEEGLRWLATRANGIAAVYLVATPAGLLALTTPGLAPRLRALVPDLSLQESR
jgi:thiamine biosynthesis lipoprotein